ncbi:MAG: 50S ribosomal protein L24 [Gammaproteobacteria bacterium]|nr:50S ribosomal protein L24 [Gammaproteobacteria bacterium]
MRKFRKNDDVIVTTGRDKGKRGNIVRVLDNDKVIVENVAMVKRHTKPNPNRGVSGGIVEKESAIHVSNIAHFNPVTKKADRVGFRVLEDGKKVRYFKSNNEVLDS